MFSDVKEPYFDFRLVETRFDGFDLVHEIQFRGSLPFTDGKDIRQWEGVVLIDAFKFTPLEIRRQGTSITAELVVIACFFFTDIPYLWFNVIGCIFVITMAYLINPFCWKREKSNLSNN